MKQFEVVVPDFVWAEIDAQVVYIAQDSVDNALAWEIRLRAEILTLVSSTDTVATKRQAIAANQIFGSAFSKAPT